MPDQLKCSRCGALLGPEVPGGLCLRCLLRFGLKDELSPEPVGLDPTPASAIPPGAGPDEVGGRYRLIEKIGEGGCGIVYRAGQLEPVRREVALKVIKLGMDTRNVIARFEAERQALALMDHPGIARVFDAGTTHSGRPYFVMELVRGKRITDFCGDTQLDLTLRLNLFAEVCRAIQHAHQKGIIHRDIKPSNVLVVESDGRPQPKVIDFGVAKATARQRLGDETIYTAFDQFVGTPAYMSPEQAGLTGDDVDTRSDIYSLGVLLYELLTGRPPFDPERLRRAALSEVCRIICEEEPVKPSTRLAHVAKLENRAPKSEGAPARRLPHAAVDRDLDWIVMKALEKDRARRYETANDLAADIQRFLAHEPVLAHAPTTGYRLRKLVQRHRSAATTILLVSLSLVAGIVGSAVMAVRARNAEAEQRHLRQEAQQQADAGQRVITLLNNTYNNWRPAEGRRRHTLAWTGVIETLRDRAGTTLKQQEPLVGRLMFLMIQADHFSWSGDLPDAETLLRKALDLSGQLPSDNEDIHAGIMECLALVLRRMHRTEETDQLFREALALREKVQKSDPVAIQSSYAYGYLYDYARQHGQLAIAEDMGRHQVAALKQRYGATNLATAEVLLNLGTVYAGEGKTNEAGAAYRAALAGMRSVEIATNDPEIDEIHGDFVRSRDTVAAFFARTGDLAGAARLAVETAELLASYDQGAQAETHYARAIAWFRQIPQVRPQDEAVLRKIAAHLEAQGRHAEAEALRTARARRTLKAPAQK